MPSRHLLAHAIRPRDAAGHAAARPAGTSPYVNQFLLGPTFVERLADWQRVTVAGQLKLTAHPDLACTQVTEAGREITLIGHMLDPHAPDATNADIIRALICEFTGRDNLIRATHRFGGRWLLIAAHAEERFLFHDPMGLRQAFYTDPAEIGSFWVMSQAGIAGEVLALAPDALALDYMDTQTFRRTSESRFPAAASTFRGLRHLLPNHWLDLRTGSSRRYWPSQPLPALGPAEAADRLLALMTGQIRAIAARFDAALSLTAGIDSRLVLAAARDVAARLSIVTLRQGKMPDKHADIEVPNRLLGRLGLTHEVIRAAPTMTPEFAMQFKRNVYLAHDLYGHDAEAILRHFNRSKAALTGSGAEIGRCPFRGKLPHADYVQFTPETLAWLEYGSTHPFLVQHFRDWLQDAGRQDHVKLLDLFEWEQDYGNWLAMTQLEFDIAWREIFTPYNCRALLETMLGADERFRRAPDYQLFRRAIAKAWPELLSEPINPHASVGRLALRIADLKAIVKYWQFRRTQPR